MAENPKDAIRAYCLECNAGSAKELKNCTSTDCFLYPLRMGKKRVDSTRLKAIRRHCVDCQGGRTAASGCASFDCELHDYRQGAISEPAGMVGKLVR